MYGRPLSYIVKAPRDRPEGQSRHAVPAAATVNPERADALMKVQPGPACVQMRRSIDKQRTKAGDLGHIRMI